MSTHHLSTLIAFKKHSQSFEIFFLKDFLKDFIKFLNECIVNLLRGELGENQEQELLKFRIKKKEIILLILKRNSLRKRRQILRSKTGSVLNQF